MRKLKVQVQITIDGFIAGKNGEMDWIHFPWSDDIMDYVRKLTEPIDLILLGRNLAEGFIPHWAAVAQNPSDPEFEGGQIFANTAKVVFSKTLTESKWENTVVSNGNYVDEINKLKKQSGKDIIAYGGGQFVSALLKEQLVDELYLFVNPSVIGVGMPIFREVAATQNYEFAEVKLFSCGIVVQKLLLKKG